MRREWALLALLAAMVVGVQLKNPGFVTVQNMRDVLVQVAPFAIMACGAAFVIVLGEIDISIGSMAGVLAAFLGTAVSMTHWGWPIWTSVGLMLAMGGALGLANGVLVVFGKVPSIIVTLGMLTGLRGVTELVLKGEWVTDLPDGLRKFGIGEWLGLPVPIFVAVGVCVAAWIAATQTPLGLRVYAVGGNPDAASMRGLNAKGLRILAFVTMGVLTAIAALISAPRLSVIESGFGAQWELFVVTCVVVGGVSIKGGKGTIPGVLIAVLILGIVRTALLFLKLGDDAVYWERAIQGALIILAVLTDFRGRRRK